MISLSAHNKMKEKNHPKRQDNTHGRKEEEKKLKGDKKKTLTSKQKVNVNLMGNLVFYTYHKGICCCSNKRDNFKTTFGYLEFIFLLSIPHPVAIGNMYLVVTTHFFKGVHIVLLNLQSDLHFLWCKCTCMFLII